MDQQKIFFSYSRIDASDFALRLYNDLKNAGADVWIDQKDIKAGLRWDIEIGNALKACQCVLFIASKQSIESNNVLDEVYYALDNKKHVIPVLFALCDIPYRINRLQRVDFIIDYDPAFHWLLNTIQTTTQDQQNVEKPDKVNDRQEKLFDDKKYLTELEEADDCYEQQENEEAIKIYLKYPKKLSGEQCERIGVSYGNGFGVKQDFEEALKWYTKAVELGNISAIVKIGILYYYGQGVTKDCNKAIELYMKAARLGNTRAMCVLGNSYTNKDTLDYKKAMKWYQKAAELGDKYPFAHIGDLYMHGHGVSQDAEEAKRWYRKGAEKDDTLAKVRLEELEKYSLSGIVRWFKDKLTLL
jgi:hypothetical protein